MVWPLHFAVILFAGIVLGVIGWHFETNSLSFDGPSIASLEAFPLRTFLPGLVVGIGLTMLYNYRWRDFGRRFWVYIRKAFNGIDVLIVGLACLAILFML